MSATLSPAPALSRPINVYRDPGCLVELASHEQRLARYGHQHGITGTGAREQRLLAAFEMTYDRAAVLRELRVRGDWDLARWLEHNAAPEADDDIPF